MSNYLKQDDMLLDNNCKLLTSEPLLGQHLCRGCLPDENVRGPALYLQFWKAANSKLHAAADISGCSVEVQKGKNYCHIYFQETISHLTGLALYILSFSDLVFF